MSLDEATKHSSCVPLYMFYHPVSALASTSGALPAVEGVNWMFADHVPVKVSTSRWPVAERKLEKWRHYFQPLHRLLCFGHDIGSVTVTTGPGQRDGFAAYLIPVGTSKPTPGELEDMLNELLDSYEDLRDRKPIRASQVIPPTTLAAMAAFRDGGEMPELPRKRAIFVTTKRIL
ncbi:DUF6615 family protein [Acetobacter indonesiensis]|uniref:DUF6615 family protein n=1 Tax=Acetobacter indonesiensis TaxID=104101 RepID=UPI003144E4BC